MIQKGRNNPSKIRNRRERGGLTLMELFPLFIAVFVFTASAVILRKHYGNSSIVWIIAAVLGTGSWIVYALLRGALVTGHEIYTNTLIFGHFKREQCLHNYELINNYFEMETQTMNSKIKSTIALLSPLVNRQS